jgi:hypothetical protein
MPGSSRNSVPVDRISNVFIVRSLARPGVGKRSGKYFANRSRPEGLDQMIQIAGAAHKGVYLNSLPANNVEDKIGFNDQNSVAVLAKLRVTRNTTGKRLMPELSDSYIKLINKPDCPVRAFLCNELENGDQIVLSGRKTPKGRFTGHLPVDVAARTNSFRHYHEPSDRLLKLHPIFAELCSNLTFRIESPVIPTPLLRTPALVIYVERPDLASMTLKRRAGT